MEMTLEQAREMAELTDRIAFNLNAAAKNIRAISENEMDERNDRTGLSLYSLLEKTSKIAANLNAAANCIGTIRQNEMDERNDLTGLDLYSLLKKTSKIVSNLAVVAKDGAPEETPLTKALKTQADAKAAGAFDPEGMDL
jgi:hypothetical protein